MLKPVKMSKVRAICLKASAPSVIKALHNLGAVHLKDAELPELERAGPLSSYDDISSRLIRIRSMRESLGKNLKVPKRPHLLEDPVREADEMLQESEKLALLIKQKEDLSKELEAASNSQKSLADIAGLHVNFSHLNAGSVQFALLKSSGDKASKAEKHLSKRKNSSFTKAASEGTAKVFLIAIPKSEDFKSLEGFGQILPLPRLSSTPRHELSVLKEKAAELQEKLQLLEGKLSRFSEFHSPKLLAIEEALSIEAERARISSMFSASASLYYIEGFVESGKVRWLESELHRRFGKRVHISEASIGHDELPPTKLSNPAQAGPFQFLVEFLSTTNYNEIDPSVLLLFWVPLLYALIFGDAGYAVFSFLMAFAMYKKSAPGGLLSNLAKIWMISAIPAFLAGIVFDEYFGFTHEHLLSLLGFGSMKLYEGFHRVSSVSSLMYLTIMVGMAHLALGFLLGAINEWGHNRKHSIAKLSWIGVEIAGYFIVASFMFNAYTDLGVPAIGLMVLSIAGLVAGEGPIAAVEMPGLASNIMSYIRIAAVGVGGVILAEAINELLLPKFELSPLGIVIFIITLAIYILVHAVSCFIAMFESFIHGARLNVVEFFGKFYKGNGIRFNPFRTRRLYTQES